MENTSPEFQAFDEKVQEFSTALMLADPGDLSSFSQTLNILEAIENTAWAEQNPNVKKITQQIRERLEQVIMGEADFEESVSKIEVAITAMMEGEEAPETEEKKEAAAQAEVDAEAAPEKQAAETAEAETAETADEPDEEMDTAGPGGVRAASGRPGVIAGIPGGSP